MDKVSFKLNGKFTIPSGQLSEMYNPLQVFQLNNESISGLRSDKFNFDINHPVEMLPSFSYDGSTDLILLDDKNKPRLINSRFKIKENNTYEVVQRIGNNFDNIIENDYFELNTSLQRLNGQLPKIKLKAVTTPGDFKVGNYVFYLKYSDSDGNLTDIVAESGIISMFSGINRCPKTINGGYRDENSNKSIILSFDNLNTGYKYLKLYYSRETSDIDQNRVSEFYEIDKEFEFSKSSHYIRITGSESITPIGEDELNINYTILSSAKTGVFCQNRLFLGNLSSNIDNYKDLSDISLRMFPYYVKHKSSDLIGNVNTRTYLDQTNINSNYEYYNVDNIYNHVGYWNEEIYRFGIVYVYSDGSLSRVYNIRGIDILPSKEEINVYSIPETFLYSNTNKICYIEHDELTHKINNTENDAGVFRINANDSSVNSIYSIGIYISNFDEIKDYLKNTLNIAGFFFVRQKRLPTILAQSVILNTSGGSNPLVNVPLINDGSDNYIERFCDDFGTLTQNYESRLLKLDSVNNHSLAGICPEYNLNQPYYNQLFTGASIKSKKVSYSSFEKFGRHYYQSNNTSDNSPFDEIKVLGIPDNTKTMAIDDTTFNGIAGIEAEAFRVGFIKSKASIQYEEWDPLKNTRNLKQNQTSYIRGIFGPYLGITGCADKVGDTINIYIPGYNNSKDSMKSYFEIRYNDSSSYYAVTDRYSLDEIVLNGGYWDQSIFRGDCYICNYTHRLNRNFADSSSVNNNVIVDDETWRKYYNTDPKHTEVLANINRSDINSVQLGSWITVKVCCSSNISLRALDKSFPDEKSLHGHYRNFYPLSSMNASSDNNIPESFVLNKGFEASVGHRWNAKLNNVKYLNNDYTNRIIYSNTKVSNQYTNAYRTFEAGNYRDYNMEKGELTKLIECGDNIICVFEHGVGVLRVSEKVQVSDQDGGVFLNSREILPEKLTFLSSEFGSKWPESIIKTQSQKIYGVDSEAKKIWMIAGDQFKIISDLIIGEFLNNNINISNLDKELIIGSKNIKTHYNAFKGDVMFTFYTPCKSNSKFETTWNICYNDILQKWISFYSWTPLASENINNVFYSFDRNYARAINYLNFVNQDINSYLNNDLIDDNQKRIFCRIVCNKEWNKQEFELNPNKYKLNYSNELYKHNLDQNIKPCFWYNKQHPFEIEVIVNDTPQVHKIFNNLRLLSNKAKPESFHYEIIGECFDFNNDKNNAYYRQEAKKELFRNLGSNISYNDDYQNIKLKQNIRSISFPLYYARLDTDQNVEDDYIALNKEYLGKDYKYLTGTELINYPKLNEIRLNTHAKGVDVKEHGLLRGNMKYLEDCWNIQINPIVIVEKNENDWKAGIPPLDIFNAKIPLDIEKTNLSKEDLPKHYNTLDSVDETTWSKRREIKLKDKWIKVRIRYSGEDLALISALYTMYSVSYA